jgi:glycosyltransferase involved in cell wall biosynthesis
MRLQSVMQASIIIPTYNGGNLLRRSLQAIYAQQTSKAYEVIIVDSGSNADTKRIFREYPVRLHEIPNREFNHGLTRDLGATYAGGEFLLFLNQDAEPGDSRWLDLMVQPMIDNPAIAAMQGGIRERDDMPRFFWDSCGERFYFTSESKNWIRRFHDIGFSTVNCAIRRSVWEKHPFGKMDIMEDKGFQRRVHLEGYEIAYSEGWVYHTHDYDLDQLRRRCQDEGYGWRLVGEAYSLGLAIRDTFLWKNYIELLRGLWNGRVKKPAEVVYPFLRPYWVYKGNRLNRSLVGKE